MKLFSKSLKSEEVINFLKENKPKFQIFNMATSLERYCNDYFKKKIRTIKIENLKNKKKIFIKSGYLCHACYFNRF